MKLLQRATPEAYRQAIEDERNNGRLPLAWITWGEIEGLGWGFLHPWDQQALFPHKGSLGGIGHPGRVHETFLVIRFWRSWSMQAHRNHEYPTTGRFYRGLVWRKSWGIRPRLALLSPDVFKDQDGERVHA